MLEKGAPQLCKQLMGLQQSITSDGALSAKTKTLMMLMGDAILGHAEGCANLSKRALSLGAADAEIAETLAMAFLMGVLPGVVTGANACKE
jgi:alkylhydroperoxidase/carboxymuconolactone decarboxylase family protein YurZ